MRNGLWILLPGLLPVLMLSSSCGGGDQAQTQDHGPEYSVPGDSIALYLCPGMEHGIAQSPINIVTREVVAESGGHLIITHFGTDHELVVNKGYTVEVDYEPGSYTEFEEKKYQLRQFHFHTPSEHLTDGLTYPMEMHVVHEEVGADALPEKPHYLVLGLLFKEGQASVFLDEFLEDVPEHKGEAVFSRDLVNLYDLLDFQLGDYYYYRGSLTTPPYTESVDWVVLKKIFEASPGQITSINELEGNNARHIQRLNDRKVLERSRE